LVNDHWHPPQPLSVLSRHEASKYRHMATLVLRAACQSPAENDDEPDTNDGEDYLNARRGHPGMDRSPTEYATLSDGWRRQDEIARIIDKHVRSEPDKHFVDRRWLVGVSEAAAEIAALFSRSQPVTIDEAHVYAGGGDGTFDEREPDDEFVLKARAAASKMEPRG